MDGTSSRVELSSSKTQHNATPVPQKQRSLVQVPVATQYEHGSTTTYDKVENVLFQVGSRAADAADLSCSNHFGDRDPQLSRAHRTRLLRQI